MIEIFCDTDHTKELWVRQALKGLNTHGKSMEMKMKNGRRPLVEIFDQGLKNLGEVGVKNIIDSVVHKLSALTEDDDLGDHVINLLPNFIREGNAPPAVQHLSCPR